MGVKSINHPLEMFYAETRPKGDVSRILERIMQPYEDISYRVPFVFQTSMRTAQGIAPVRMRLNPQTVTFQQGKRITRRDTQEGAIFFYWSNARGYNNDVLNISFSGQTGNLNLRTGASRTNYASNRLGQFQDFVKAATKQEGLDVKSLSGSAKMLNFWSLYALTREPMYDVSTGEPNRFSVQYASPILGNTLITFWGFFDKVLEFTDTAQSPYNKDYNFSFVATESMPSLDDIYKTVSNNLGNEFFGVLS